MNSSLFFSEKSLPKRIIPETIFYDIDYSKINPIIRVLDEMDSPIYMVDRSTRICYFNKCYYETYSSELAQYVKGNLDDHVEALLGLSCSDDLAEIESEPLRRSMELNQPILHKAFAGNEQHLSSIYPLHSGDSVIGALIIGQNMDNIIHMNHEIAKYKSLVHTLHQELYEKKQLPDAFQSIIGSSESFLKVLRIAAQVAPTLASVCLSGESGTGKEVLANAIHRASSRMEGSLVKVNCAAIPENLIESELFGYEKGAFTGANATGKPGKFELANNGTLFLDEIGEMPLSMQVKLLRALQEKEVTRVGGTKTIKVDFRLITATNCNLEEMVSKGLFREDLYYRINVINLKLPALRKRKQDIPLLVHHFLTEMNGTYGKNVSISGDTLALMTNYDWPGNIRELKNCIERMVIICTEDEIQPNLLPPQFWNEDDTVIDVTPETLRLQPLLDKLEKETIIKAMNQTGGNKSKAIELLGISKRNFYMKLEKYHIN